MTIVAILQPSYLPWLGFFDQVRAVDIFVYYDSVQFDKNGWRNRNKIKTASGAEWLTVPVKRAHHSIQAIQDTEIAIEHGWGRKHLKTLIEAYAKAPYRDLYLPSLQDIICKKHTKLVDLIYELNTKIFEWLEIDTKIVRSSDLVAEGDRNERLINICRQIGATNYFSGNSAHNYLDTPSFSAAGIQVTWQEYSHPIYRQLHGEFLSHLSIVDLLFNEGPRSKEIY